MEPGASDSVGRQGSLSRQAASRNDNAENGGGPLKYRTIGGDVNVSSNEIVTVP